MKLVRTLWVNSMPESKIPPPEDVGDLDIFYATSVEEAGAILGEEAYDILLLDLSTTPDSLMALSQILAVATMPVVALTTEDQSEIGLAAVRNGAADWLTSAEGPLVARSWMLSSTRQESQEQIIQSESETNRLLEETWVKTGEARMHGVLRNDMAIDELCNNIVSFLCDYTMVTEGRFYTVEAAGQARLMAGVGPLPPSVSLDHFSLGDSRLGNAARKRECMMFSEPDEQDESVLRYYLVAPCVSEDDELVGMVELGSTPHQGEQELRLLEEVSAPIAVAVRAARRRHEKEELLAATQKLAHELQVQQMELKFAYSQLEDEVRSLEASNERLRLELQRAEAQPAAEDDPFGQVFGVGDDLVHESTAVIKHAIAEAFSAPTPEAQLARLEQARNELTDLVEILNTDFSAIEVEPMMLCEHLDETFRPLAEERGLSFDVKLAEEVPAVIHSDSEQLHAILGDLLQRAISSTDEGMVSLVVERALQEEMPDDLAEDVLVFAVEDQRTEHLPEGQLPLSLLCTAQRAVAIGGWLVRDFADDGETYSLYVSSSAIESLAPLAELSDGVMDDRQTILAGDDIALIFTADPTQASRILAQCRTQGLKGIVCETDEDLLVLPFPPKCALVDAEDPHELSTRITSLRRNSALRSVPLAAFGIPQHELEARRSGAQIYLRLPLEEEEVQAALTQLREYATEETAAVLVAEGGRSLLTSMMPYADLLGLELDGVTSLAEIAATLEEGDYAAMIMHAELGRGNWFEVRRLIADLNPYLPVIIYTGKRIDEQEARRLEAFAAGAVVRQANTPSELLEDLMLFIPVATISAQEDVSFLEGRTILLADDDMRNTFALGQALEASGAVVRMAESGSKAVQILAETPDIEAALVDSFMPGKDGPDTIREVRQVSALPILAMLTANASEERQRCADSGANDYLVKPIEIEKLLATLKVLLATGT